AAVLFVIGLGMTPPALATTWHLATDGSDSNGNGSPGLPYGTPAKGVSMAQPGDTVLLHGGTYHTATVGLYRDATLALPIVIRSPPGEWGVLDGSTAASGTPIFYIQGSGYEIRSLEVANARKSAFSIEGAHDLVIADCLVHDSIGGAIYPYGGAHHLRIERNE